MPLSRITDMLQLASTNDRLFPPTLFYNEGWLLRLVLNWFAHHRNIDHPLAFATGARWYSEALLPSQFFARQRGDSLAEGWTHADGVVGHVVIGDSALADTTLAPDATQFLVIEAKLFSRLSPRVTHAVGYDQAARNAACIAEVLCRGKRKPGEFRTLGFFVIAPADQIKRGVFANEMSRTSIASKVASRVASYETSCRENKEAWRSEWFEPTLAKLSIACLTWEEIIEFIQRVEDSFGSSLADFYDQCLKFNKIQEPEQPNPIQHQFVA